MKYNFDMICPECHGAGHIGLDECYYCEGTGYATDDDAFEHMYKYDDGSY